MPTYEYRCSRGHTCDRLRKYIQRDRPVTCGVCGRKMKRQVTFPHVEPDGIYSYAPNIGSAEAFERRRAAAKERMEGGSGIIPKQDMPRIEE